MKTVDRLQIDYVVSIFLRTAALMSSLSKVMPLATLKLEPSKALEGLHTIPLDAASGGAPCDTYAIADKVDNAESIIEVIEAQLEKAAPDSSGVVQILITAYNDLKKELAR